MRRYTDREKGGKRHTEREREKARALYFFFVCTMIAPLCIACTHCVALPFTFDWLGLAWAGFGGLDLEGWKEGWLARLSRYGWLVYICVGFFCCVRILYVKGEGEK